MPARSSSSLPTRGAWLRLCLVREMTLRNLRYWISSHGAASKVYLALERTVGNRRVVLKISPSTNFEASILGRLVHPCITPLFSNGYVADCNLHYLCMPFLGRSTLVDVIEIAFRRGWPRNDRAVHQATTRWEIIDGCSVEKSARWPFRIEFGTYVDSIVTIAMQIAEGLTVAHNNGVLHCDLKPSNVLLTPELRRSFWTSISLNTFRTRRFRGAAQFLTCRPNISN